MRALMAQARRLYTLHGNVVHFHLSDAATTFCGLPYHPEVFFGTGTQDEYDLAEVLDVCPKCGKEAT